MAQGDIKVVQENAGGTYDEILLEETALPAIGGNTLQVTGLSLVAANWTTGATYKEYALSNANITANSIVEVIPANADYEIVLAAEILPSVTASAGTVTIYAVNTPTGNIGVTINITEKSV